MSSRIECRLLIDPPGPGPWNMALDEALLEWSAAEGGWCWRFYAWEEPTLSLGYFQPYADRRGHAPSRDCPAVRRLTGGGAIVHHAELTYSLVVPGAAPVAARRDLLYENVHTTLIEVLAELGIQAELHGKSDRGGTRQEPFLCFQRRAPGDVVAGRRKIAGSAQRRRRGAVLQHGSVVLRRSSAAPEVEGLEELLGAAVDRDQLARAWLNSLARRMSLRWSRWALPSDERRRALQLARGRYNCRNWTQDRQR